MASAVQLAALNATVAALTTTVQAQAAALAALNATVSADPSLAADLGRAYWPVLVNNAASRMRRDKASLLSGRY